MKFAAVHLISFGPALHMHCIIRFIAQYGVLHARSSSFLGQNVLFCNYVTIHYVTINTVINSFFFKSIDESMRGSANFLLELLMIRDVVKSNY